MTTLLVNVRDDTKVDDVLSFLRDIDFLEVIVKDEDVSPKKIRRKPAPELLQTRIVGNIVDPVVSDSDWEAMCEPAS